MANNLPVFSSTPRIGYGTVSTANTQFDGTGTVVDILTGVAAGTRIERVVAACGGSTTPNPADSMVNFFIHDGTSYRYFDTWDIGDPAAGSTTVAPYREERAYSDLILPTASYKLAASITVALTSGTFSVFAFGSDLT